MTTLFNRIISERRNLFIISMVLLIPTLARWLYLFLPYVMDNPPKGVILLIGSYFIVGLGMFIHGMFTENGVISNYCRHDLSLMSTSSEGINNLPTNAHVYLCSKCAKRVHVRHDDKSVRVMGERLDTTLMEDLRDFDLKFLFNGLIINGSVLIFLAYVSHLPWNIMAVPAVVLLGYALTVTSLQVRRQVNALVVK